MGMGVGMIGRWGAGGCFEDEEVFREASFLCFMGGTIGFMYNLLWISRLWVELNLPTGLAVTY